MTVHAQTSALLEYKDIDSNIQQHAGLGAASPQSISISLINTIVGILGLVFLVLAVFAGVQWLTAQGNMDKVEESKKTLSMAIIGLVIMISAYSIYYYFFLRLVGVTGSGEIPTDTFEGSGLSTNTLFDTVGSVGTTILSFIAIIVVGFIIYAAYMWMTARGNADQVQKAQQIIMRTVIGLAIVLGSWGLTIWVLSAVLPATDRRFERSDSSGELESIGDAIRDRTE